jgi:hypothetical protein
MRGVVGRQDGKHLQPFQRTMTRSSAGRLDLNQEIGFELLFTAAPLLDVDPVGRSEHPLVLFLLK